MLKKLTLLLSKKYNSTRNKLIRKYYELKLLGYEGIILKAGSEKEVLSRGAMYKDFKEDITSDIHILTEDAIQYTIQKESEEYKKGFRKFGEVYLEFLKECYRFKIDKESPDELENAKKKIEKDMISKTQGKYPTT